MESKFADWVRGKAGTCKGCYRSSKAFEKPVHLESRSFVEAKTSKKPSTKKENISC